jgi:hypothetical protein
MTQVQDAGKERHVTVVIASRGIRGDESDSCKSRRPILSELNFLDGMGEAN